MNELENKYKNLFDENELDRVDKNIDYVKSSLSETEKKFTRATILIFLSLFSFHLLLIGESSDIIIFGLKIANKEFALTWFLIIPSILLVIRALYGYLRVYQKETISWLLFYYRRKEYNSELYRVAYPSNEILALDLMRRCEKNRSSLYVKILSVFFAFITLIAPYSYIVYGYIKCMELYPGSLEVYISSGISFLIIIQQSIIINLSQEL